MSCLAQCEHVTELVCMCLCWWVCGCVSVSVLTTCMARRQPASKHSPVSLFWSLPAQQAQSDTPSQPGMHCPAGPMVSVHALTAEVVLQLTLQLLALLQLCTSMLDPPCLQPSTLKPN